MNVGENIFEKVGFARAICQDIIVLEGKLSEQNRNQKKCHEEMRNKGSVCVRD